MSFYNRTLKSHYTKLPNELIRNKNISDGAFRFICWIVSHSEGFKISFKSIENQLGYGRAKMRSIISEAEENNYLVRVKIRNEKGQFEQDYYVFSDVEDCIDFKSTSEFEQLESRVLKSTPGPGVTYPPVGDTTVVLATGGPTTPHKKNNIEKKKIKEEQREKEESLTQDFDAEISENSPEPENAIASPKSENSALAQIGISQLTENLASGQNSSPLVNAEKCSIEPVIKEQRAALMPQGSSVLTSNPPAPQPSQIERYRDLDASGTKLTKLELQQWAKQELGEIIATYRKSGCILVGGEDVSSEFAVFVARKNCRRGEQPEIALGFNVIRKCEENPRQWQNIQAWVFEWQAGKNTGQSVNIGAAIAAQQKAQETPKYSFKF